MVDLSNFRTGRDCILVKSKVNYMLLMSDLRKLGFKWSLREPNYIPRDIIKGRYSCYIFLETNKEIMFLPIDDDPKEMEPCPKVFNVCDLLDWGEFKSYWEYYYAARSDSKEFLEKQRTLLSMFIGKKDIEHRLDIVNSLLEKEELW